jgi:hypothetical protein
MAVVLIADAGSPTANSFCDLATANAYFAGLLYADDWTDADEDTQTRALITATLLIVVAIADGWGGWPASTTQALPMPRSGLRSRLNAAIPSNVIPLALAYATAEYARQLISAGAMPSAPSDTAGLKRVKAGPVEIEFDGSASVGSDGRLPIDIFAMFGFLVEAWSRNRTCVPLERV